MLIETRDALKQLIIKLHDASYLVVDTEFMWCNTYLPIPALIQIAYKKETYLIDVVLIDDKDLLKELFINSRLYVFHANKQDLFLLKNVFDITLENIFDTQLAHSFLAEDHQISYNSLIKYYLNHTLSDNSPHHKKWLTRPLTNHQKEYAINDVYYLDQVWQILYDKLKENKRFDFYQEELTKLLNEKPKELYQKIKYASKLPQEQFVLLKDLLVFRENIAKELNKIPRHIIDDNTLLYLSKIKPESIKKLKKVNTLSSFMKKKYGEEIISLINNFSCEGKDKSLVQPLYLNESGLSKYKGLKKRTIIWAEDYNMAASLLLPSKLAKKLVCAWQNNSDYKVLLDNWRKELLQEKLQEFFS